MRKATLDTNCLVALFKKEPRHEIIISLLAAHRTGLIQLRLVAISATDLVSDGRPVQDLNDFHRWVSDLGLQGIEVVLPLGISGLVFYGGALYGDDDGGPMDNLYNQVGKILFPHVYPASEASIPTRNQACDVLMMWSHIYHHGDIFVSPDKNFSKVTKRPQLQALGAGLILTPLELTESISDQPS